MEFISNGAQYMYSISILRDVVESEKLEKYNTAKKRYRYIFIRKLNKVNTKNPRVKNKSEILEVNKQDLDRLGNDFSLFSLLLELNYLKKKEFFILTNILYNAKIGIAPTRSSPIRTMNHLAEELQKNNILLSDLVDEIKAVDTGIVNLEFSKHRETKTDKNGENREEEILHIFTEHVVNTNKHILHIFEESDGTRNYMALFIKMYSILLNGGILIGDELEQSLHPDITERILNTFLDRDKNPNNAQIIFSTHNPWFLQYLTKTQIYITEKNDIAETNLTRLDDIKGVRNDENYFIKYINGEYDGKPKIQDI
jgi:AAA15 family ATPase/GTPase